ncbi:MAG: 50S ribosomal protein L6 [Rickettsiales bacterium]|nr:50S ribosomal protein L6 [Rickettsiales bacterium]HAE76010.1 50S ribosomal protein L6 [Alphaproteobacteria bacterium]
MGRLNKYPIKIPEGVEVSITDQNMLKAKGKLGEQSYGLSPYVQIKIGESQLFVNLKDESKVSQIQGGTIRSLLANLIQGVDQGYSKTLEVSGVGYRAQVKGKVLNLQLGFSHDVNFDIPDGIEIKCKNQNQISISGINKHLVGQVAAKIRNFRKPEPYKGKGIKYQDEVIVRKEGKKK